MKRIKVRSRMMHTEDAWPPDPSEARTNRIIGSFAALGGGIISGAPSTPTRHTAAPEDPARASQWMPH
jgi:hypothetical protein